MTFSIGTTVRFTATFRLEATQALVDPTTVTLRLRSPAGVETSYTWAASQITRDSVGVFHFDFTPSTAGTWHRRWVGTGTAAVTTEGRFVVEPSAFASP